MYFARWPLAGGTVYRIVQPRLHAFYVDRINEIWGLPSMYDRFPGSNPVSIMQSDLPIFRQFKFVIAEKTDGLRFLVVLTRSPDNQQTLLLVERSYALYVVPGMLFAPTLYDGTILDSELVLDTPKDGDAVAPPQWSLYIYDLVTAAGERFQHRTHSQRYKRLLELLKSEYRAQSEQLFQVQPKAFHPVSFLPELVDRVIPALPHANDGVIFTQVSAPYKCGMQRSILKWKRREMHTVDYHCKLATEETGTPPGTWVLELHVTDAGGQLVLANHVLVDAADLAALGVRDVGELEATILECSWDADEGWRPLKIRYDKAGPNAEYTLRKTVDNIKENIQLDDIYAMYQQTS